MTAILKSQDDPRSPLQRMRRYELIAYARANGIMDVNDNTPALLIMKKCREKNLHGLNIPRPPLGAPYAGQPGLVQPEGKVTEINAEADLERQFAQPQLPPPAPVVERKSLATMTIIELRRECQRLDIKLGRRDNMITMRQKIEAHG